MKSGNFVKRFVDSRGLFEIIRWCRSVNGICFNIASISKYAFRRHEFTNNESFQEWFDMFSKINGLVEGVHYRKESSAIWISGAVAINIILRSKTIYSKIARNICRTTWIEIEECLHKNAA